jgi:hypothetical protein
VLSSLLPSPLYFDQRLHSFENAILGREQKVLFKKRSDFINQLLLLLDKHLQLLANANRLGHTLTGLSGLLLLFSLPIVLRLGGCCQNLLVDSFEHTGVLLIVELLLKPLSDTSTPSTVDDALFPVLMLQLTKSYRDRIVLGVSAVLFVAVATVHETDMGHLARETLLKMMMIIAIKHRDFPFGCKTLRSVMRRCQDSETGIRSLSAGGLARQRWFAIFGWDLAHKCRKQVRLKWSESGLDSVKHVVVEVFGLRPVGVGVIDRATGGWRCRRSKRYAPAVFFRPLLRLVLAELGNDVLRNVVATVKEEITVIFRKRTEARLDVRVDGFYRDSVGRFRVRKVSFRSFGQSVRKNVINVGCKGDVGDAVRVRARRNCDPSPSLALSFP